MPQPAELHRRLGVADAVVIGLGSMIGAGVFAAFGPAARAAGAGLLLGLAVAAVIAYCNATASAQLAAVYPTSGGTYVYGRERLGHWWGFAAGWGFVTGKTASCAAMALTVGVYVAPGSWWLQRVVAAVAVIALGSVNYRGITRTTAVTRVLVAVTCTVLLAVVVACVIGGRAAGAGDGWAPFETGGVYGVLQSAGLLFFAFAGYARIATLGEEVVAPERTIPRAIPLALGIAVIVYGLVGASALFAAGPDRLAAARAPLVAAVQAADAGGLALVVRVGGTAAALGALLALLAGIGRTTLAMARHRDLPGWLAAVHPRFRVPHRAETALTVLLVVVVLTADLRGAIGFSSFGVLIYYGIANAAAISQPAAQRRWPRWLHVVGVAGCALLVTTLPWPSIGSGAAVFAVGLVGRLVARRAGRRPIEAPRG